MSKSRFQLSYDGPVLKSGTMDVTELAPALLAAANLFKEANRRLNGDNTDVSVRVQSEFKRGSFEIQLVLDQTVIDAARPLMFPVLGAAALFTVLFGTEGIKKGLVGAAVSVLDLWKMLRGEKPAAINEGTGKNISIVVTGSNNRVVADSTVAQLYADEKVRLALEGTASPLAKPGMNSLTIKRGQKSVNAVIKSDMPERGSETTPGLLVNSKANVLRDTREAVLRVARANFENGKWGFSDGSAHFSADIEDPEFKAKLDSSEIGFYKGDLLHVLLRTTQVVSSDQSFHTKYAIEKVLDHVHAPRQVPLIRVSVDDEPKALPEVPRRVRQTKLLPPQT